VCCLNETTTASTTPIITFIQFLQHNNLQQFLRSIHIKVIEGVGRKGPTGTIA